MTPAAFYAPLKPPTHPNPSGDRAMARALMAALELAGFAPDLASEFRTREGKGDAARQDALMADADRVLPGLIDTGRARGWRLWLTYHNYYKAPDLLGPRVAAALGIPYVQVESTRARKRFGGPWDAFAHQAEAAADAAQVIFHLTARDAEALDAYRTPTQQIVHLHPFLAETALPPQSNGAGDILVVGMMRLGDKLESYKLVAETLARLDGPWQVEIVGDGEARPTVEEMMAPYGDRVRFLGALDRDGMTDAYSRARVLFWPGVNEAFGLVYLEAQAAGVPVVAQDRPGVRDVLPPDLAFPKPDAGVAALAAVLAQVRRAPPDPAALRARIMRQHLLPAASTTLQHRLEPLL